MNPMILKKPTECCKSPTLLWVKGKGYYMCPCGQVKANQLGLPMRRFVCGKPSRSR